MVFDYRMTFTFLEKFLIDEYSFKAVGKLVQRVLALCVILLLIAMTCRSLLPRVS